MSASALELVLQAWLPRLRGQNAKRPGPAAGIAAMLVGGPGREGRAAEAGPHQA